MTNQNRIDLKFNELKEKGEKAFITFFTVGDPDLETSKKIIIEMVNNGADLIELGIPFSDPMAEGPVIQAANVRALERDINLDLIFDAVKEVREETQVPLVFLMYFNSLLSYGIEDFFKKCKDSGVDGVIIPDLPFEESDEIYAYTVKYGVYQISMVSPTSSKERVKKICERAKGFLYCVSSMGVTGVREKFNTDFEEIFKTLDKYPYIPKCIGFGISKTEHIEVLKKYCDGIIVGSALVKLIESGETIEEKVSSVGKKTSELSAATK